MNLAHLQAESMWKETKMQMQTQFCYGVAASGLNADEMEDRTTYPKPDKEFLVVG